MPEAFHTSPEVTEDFATPEGMLNDEMEVVPAWNVTEPGKTSVGERDRVVEPPSAGVAEEDAIWFVVPAMPMVEFARCALASGKPNPASERSEPPVLLNRVMS